MLRILRRAVTARRAHILANARRFFSSAKNAPARPHPLPCKCNYYRFERTRARHRPRKKGGIFVRATRLKTDFQLADAGRKVTRRVHRGCALVRTRDVSDTLEPFLS